MKMTVVTLPKAAHACAVTMDRRNDNPCDRVAPVLGPQNDIVTHRPAPPHKVVAAANETVLDSKSAQPAVRMGFEILVLTMARSGWRGGTRSTRPGGCGPCRPCG